MEGKCVEQFSSLVKPPVSISYRIKEITGIDDRMVEEEAGIEQVFPAFLEFVGEEQILLGHNLKFDFSFLKAAAKKLGFTFEKKGLDTLKMARTLLTDLPRKNLETVSAHYHVVNPRAHRAYEDAETTAKVYFKMLEEFGETKPEAFVPQEMQVKIKKIEPATLKQKNYLLDLLKYHKIKVEAFLDEKGTNLNEMTKSQASRMIDEIILNYGKIMY